eukprot:8185168-Alexandrium_andersonii.AAC.1
MSPLPRRRRPWGASCALGPGRRRSTRRARGRSSRRPSSRSGPTGLAAASGAAPWRSRVARKVWADSRGGGRAGHLRGGR